MERWSRMAMAMAMAGVVAGCASGGSQDAESTRRVQEAGLRGEVLAGTRYGGGVGGAGEVTMRSAPDVQTDRYQLPVSPTEAWGGLLLTLEALELPVGRADAGAAVAEIRGRLPRIDGQRMSNWVDCGTGIRGETADRAYIDVVLQLQIQAVAENPEASLVDARFTGQAQPRDNQAARVPCRSRGTLEKYLAEQIAARATGA